MTYTHVDNSQSTIKHSRVLCPSLEKDVHIATPSTISIILTNDLVSPCESSKTVSFSMTQTGCSETSLPPTISDTANKHFASLELRQLFLSAGPFRLSFSLSLSTHLASPSPSLKLIQAQHSSSPCRELVVHTQKLKSSASNETPLPFQSPDKDHRRLANFLPCRTKSAAPPPSAPYRRCSPKRTL